LAKKHRGGGHKTQKPSRSTSSRPATPKTAAAPPATRLDKRIVAAIAGIAVVVLLGGFVAVGSGLGGSTPTPTPTVVATPAPTVVALSAVPAPDIEPAEAAQRWAEGALLLDVRENDEWDAGHVPGSTHIPLSGLQARVGELPGDQTILVICRSGNRSQEARDLIAAAGLTNVTSVNGGVRAWQAAGNPFEGSILG
jgi:rhodanese-related sulfurtransferase